MVTAVMVMQLVWATSRIISKVIRATEVPSQNRVECDDLAGRLSVMGKLLTRLQLQCPEAAEELARLADTLDDAHDLVVASQKSSAPARFVLAGVQAERFSKVNRRIDSHLNVLNLCCHIDTTDRLEQILANTTAPLLPIATTTTMVAADDYKVSSSSSSPGSSSHTLQLESVFLDQNPKETAMVPYVSSSTHDIAVPLAVECTWAEIAALTGNFDHVLREDCSRTVYKGRHQDGREVAVKCLKNHEAEGAFVAELEILFHLRLDHDYIVRVVGWCAEDDERMFVYEHATNGTLSDHLHGHCGGDGEASPVTSSWKARVKALLGASRAIDHLHRLATPPVIHRNLSSSSILLDESWAPRVSDFGSAVLQAPPPPTGENDDGQGQLVAEVVGTPGYVDPEYIRTRRVSAASDVYSFGVVMLEVLTGRPPVATDWEEGDPMTLFGCAVPIIESGNLDALLDNRPSQQPTPRQTTDALELVAHAAARCLWPPQDRPDMSEVVNELDKALRLIESDEPNYLTDYYT